MDDTTRKISSDESIHNSPSYFKAGMSFVNRSGSFQCGYNLRHWFFYYKDMTNIIKDSRKRTPEDIERISSLLYQLSINETELNRHG